MKIVIAGGTGFIGRRLTTMLLQTGHDIIILSRNPKKSENRLTFVKWLENGAFPEQEIKEADVFINLAGVSINEGRWTKEHQKRIYESRMTATAELIRIMNALPQLPSVFVNASAIGLYPASDHQIYTEQSTQIAEDFLARTVFDWEQKAASIENEQTRVVRMRFGVVLGNEGGALPLMVLPYKLFAGGTVGSGNQWISWIHIDDVIRAINFVITCENIRGAVNVTAPFPKRMKYFGQAIGTVMKRPHWLPVPSLAMKLALGEKSALVLKGQYVSPTVLKENDFQFSFPILEQALQDLLKPKV